MTKKFKGTGVAVITPFKNDTSIDFTSFGKVINHVIEGGVNYIVVMGTTGEVSTLTRDEKKAVLCFSIESVDNRVPVVIGIGGNNTQEIINQIKSFDLSGVDAILSVSPYYNKPNQRGIFQHYKAISACSPVPVILYNVPGRTGMNITAETTLQLAAECENIIGVKEASGNMEQIMRIIKDKPEHFIVISGDDLMTLPIIAAGGTGVISVLANAFPAEWSEMVNQCLKSNFKTAREIQFKMLEMIELLFADGSPAGVKAMLSTMGLCQNSLRLPLVPVGRTVNSRIQKAIEDLK
jgi:4-hydroxy-tetrahydrodipicolinate synthase